MNIILDLGVIAIIVLLAMNGFHRGFVKSIIDFAGVIVASVLSSFIASMLSLTIYTNFFMNKILAAASQTFSAIPSSDTVAQQSEKLMSTLPNYILNTLSFSGINAHMLSQKISQTNLSVPQLIEGLVRPTAVRLISTGLTIILFAVFMFLIGFLARIINKTLNITGLTDVNKALGGVFGVVKAIIIIMMFSLVLYFVMMFMPSNMSMSLNKGIEHSCLYKGIYNICLPNTIISAFSLK